jgi:hypothetical protein
MFGPMTLQELSKAIGVTNRLRRLVTHGCKLARRGAPAWHDITTLNRQVVGSDRIWKAGLWPVGTGQIWQDRL